MGTLTATKVKSLTKVGRHGDGAGLFLRVMATGSKQWVQRIMVDGRRLDRGLGGYPAVGLADARLLAAANKVAVVEGRNPFNGTMRVLKKSTAPTFAELAVKVWKEKRRVLKNDKHRANWIRVLEIHANPSIGTKPVDRIRQADIKKILEGLASDEKVDTAKRTRQRIREVLDDACESEYINANPVDALRRSSKRIAEGYQVKHFEAMPFGDVPDGYMRISLCKGIREARLALQFLVLSLLRGNEVRNLTWEMVDFDNQVLVIPKENMKSSRAHRVPLSEQALQVLGDAQRAVGQRRKRKPDYNPNGYIFPSPSGKPFSGNTFPDRMRKEFGKGGPQAHGFRGSYRNWAQSERVASWAAIELGPFALGRIEYRKGILARRPT